MLASDVLALAALDAIDQSVCVVDMRLPDQPLVYLNAAFTATTGFFPEEALGRNCRFLQAGLPVGPQVAEIRAILDSGSSGVVLLPNRRRDGSVFQNELSLSPLHTDGVLTHYVAVQRDVTERVRSEQSRAELARERAELTEQLQRTLSPARLPHVPGYRLAARYRPATRPDGSRGDVSGDFYDVFERATGGWFVLLGDVSGRGPRAAATASALRWSLRGAAESTDSPGELLEATGRVTLDALGERFATVAAAALPALGHPDSSSPAADLVTLALAGHPQPVLLPPDRPALLVGSPGSLVGPFPVRVEEVLLALPPASLLVLYSDGLVEAQAPSGERLEEEGLLALLSAVSLEDRRAPDAPERIAGQLMAALDEHLAGGSLDDLTLLVIGRAPSRSE